MCGIAGYFRRDGAPASADVAGRMAAALAHRGPDGAGAWADGPVALGHVRLAIRDRSEAAAEPMVAPDGAGVLVYNGEVYNDGELRDALRREGVAFRSHGDAEVVMHAVARWGAVEAARRFDGMFAFAWWDARARALWLVRDRFGTKPLHVWVRPDVVAFGSEARALRALPGVVLAVDRFELARRAVPWVATARPPPFLGLDDVPAGGAWRVAADGVTRALHSDVVEAVDPRRIVEGAREPLADAQARLRRTVEEVVRAHVVSDVPVAAFTSGGVDSNLVAAIAREARPDLVAYTMDSGGPESELAAATLAARHLDLPLRPVHVDRAAFLRAWPEAVEREELPPLHESHVAALLLARAARADGIAVALTGEGADEIFGGYDFFYRTHRQWARATRPWSRLTHAGRTRRRELDRVPFRYQAVRSERETHARLEPFLTADDDSRARRLMARFAPVGSLGRPRGRGQRGGRDAALPDADPDAPRPHHDGVVDRGPRPVRVEPHRRPRAAPARPAPAARTGRQVALQTRRRRTAAAVDRLGAEEGLPRQRRAPPRRGGAAARRLGARGVRVVARHRGRAPAADRGRPRATVPDGQHRAVRPHLRTRRTCRRPRRTLARPRALNDAGAGGRSPGRKARCATW
ncbi:MAG: asparagine synthase (glutamine-hydrolyzing) [Ottowia sp.]